jgi:hypothetical protein
MSRMDFELTELQASVQREARAIAAQFDLNYWRDHDRSKAYPWEFVRAFAAAPGRPCSWPTLEGREATDWGTGPVHVSPA